MSNRTITPAERQWLNLVSFAEGTWGPKGPRYDITFGYTPIKDLSRHPDRVVRSGGYASSAAGAYQFLTPTWQSAAKAVGARDFGPLSQDLAALHLMRRRGVNPAKDPITPQTVAKLAPEWASLPTLKGGSYYGQPSKSFQKLADFVRKQGGTLPAGAYQQVSTGGQEGSSAAAAGGVGGPIGSDDERLIRESLGRVLLDRAIGGILGGTNFASKVGVTPPPLPTPEEDVDTSELDTDPGLVEQIGEQIGGIKDYLSGLAQQSKLSEVQKVKDRMQDFVRMAQEAFKPGQPVI